MPRTAIVGLIALLAIGPLQILVEQSASAQEPRTVSTSLIHRNLNDDEQGNQVGWNPGPDPTSGNNTKVFAISDPEFNATTSTVIVNTHQSNFVVCNVDFFYGDGLFEVNCGHQDPDAPGPDEGARLHYTIVNVEPTPLPPQVLPVEPAAQAEREQRTARLTSPG